MKAIIAGGRNYRMTQADVARLDALKDELPITEVVCGMATGADRMGRDWALHRGLKVEPFPADWRSFGRAAGPIRNRNMAHYADALIVFPGGKGTADMIRAAETEKLHIIKIGRPA